MIQINDFYIVFFTHIDNYIRHLFLCKSVDISLLRIIIRLTLNTQRPIPPTDERCHKIYFRILFFQMVLNSLTIGRYCTPYNLWNLFLMCMCVYFTKIQAYLFATPLLLKQKTSETKCSRRSVFITKLMIIAFVLQLLLRSHLASFPYLRLLRNELLS